MTRIVSTSQPLTFTKINFRPYFIISLNLKKCFPFPFHCFSSRPLVTKGEEGQLRFVQTEEGRSGRSGAQRDFVASFLDSSSNNTFQHLKLRNCLELIFYLKPLALDLFDQDANLDQIDICQGLERRSKIKLLSAH